jgi:hypothetical protein
MKKKLPKTSKAEFKRFQKLINDLAKKYDTSEEVADTFFKAWMKSVKDVEKSFKQFKVR